MWWSGTLLHCFKIRNYKPSTPHADFPPATRHVDCCEVWERDLQSFPRLLSPPKWRTCGGGIGGDCTFVFRLCFSAEWWSAAVSPVAISIPSHPCHCRSPYYVTLPKHFPLTSISSGRDAKDPMQRTSTFTNTLLTETRHFFCRAWDSDRCSLSEMSGQAEEGEGLPANGGAGTAKQNTNETPAAQTTRHWRSIHLSKCELEYMRVVSFPKYRDVARGMCLWR